MYKIYGIKNCNTMKKAFEYLDKNKIPYEFHDYKKEGISSEKLTEWASQLDWEKLLNKKGTTWRGLDEQVKQSVTTEKKAVALMQEKTSVIKRPIIELGGKLVITGFDEDEYNRIHWKK